MGRQSDSIAHSAARHDAGQAAIQRPQASFTSPHQSTSCHYDEGLYEAAAFDKQRAVVACSSELPQVRILLVRVSSSAVVLRTAMLLLCPGRARLSGAASTAGVKCGSADGRAAVQPGHGSLSSQPCMGSPIQWRC